MATSLASATRRLTSPPPRNVLPSQELLDDLCSRLLLNLPEEELESFERIVFAVEFAHWFYEDNIVDSDPSLKSFTLKEFATLIFNRCEVFKPYAAHVDEIFANFNSYKLGIPVFGAIMLDESYKRCLLVKGWKRTTWSFPRGKVNRLEEGHDCAVREVLEETGFDVSALINKDEYIEKTFGPQKVRLYIISGVKSNTKFAPQTKKEISEIGWHCIDKLNCGNDMGLSRVGHGARLYMVAPFLKPLKSWISAHPSPFYQGSPVPHKGKLVWSAKMSPTASRSLITRSEAELSRSPSEASPPPPPPPLSPPDTGPGKSFRNFSFDTQAILEAMNSSFGA